MTAAKPAIGMCIGAGSVQLQEEGNDPVVLQVLPPGAHLGFCQKRAVGEAYACELRELYRLVCCAQVAAILQRPEGVACRAVASHTGENQQLTQASHDGMPEQVLTDVSGAPLRCCSLRWALGH